jgi:hypothetical protein
MNIPSKYPLGLREEYVIGQINEHKNLMYKPGEYPMG